MTRKYEYIYPHPNERSSDGSGDEGDWSNDIRNRETQLMLLTPKYKNFLPEEVSNTMYK